MIKAVYRFKEFRFRQPAVTSRGILRSKKVYFLLLYDDKMPFIYGIGECSVFPGLSMDDVADFEKKLSEIVELINRGWFNLKTPIFSYPSINFALETALKDLEQKGTRLLYPSDFTAGKDHIRINGLIWMGSQEEIQNQIDLKLALGFRCLKLKIGGLNFNDELTILAQLRRRYRVTDLEIRLDANGAFQPEEALENLYRLSELQIHSVEQPILPSQIEEMAALCETSPIPIALDEELIGKYPIENKHQLLKLINPQYLVLKPGLLGGIDSCNEWISLAEEMHIGWWITSSLETNIGLNVISQWCYTLKPKIAQGLGTGQLFENNIDSPLAVTGEKLYYFSRKKWDVSEFLSNK
jgi:o-succinylbenzoate synthase